METSRVGKHRPAKLTGQGRCSRGKQAAKWRVGAIDEQKQVTELAESGGTVCRKEERSVEHSARGGVRDLKDPD